MHIKNYFSPPMLGGSPALDLQIIENVTDVLVYSQCFHAGHIGDIDAAGVTTVYGEQDDPDSKTASTHPPAVKKLTRHIDFTRDGVRSRLVVTEHAYVCNDRGQTVEKVST